METWFTSAVVAATVSGVVSILVSMTNAIISGRRERFSRERDQFAKALAAAVSYKEFPYVVRRRRGDAPDDERARISEALRAVQQDISYYLAWLPLQSEEVGAAYEQLVRQVRRVAGEQIRVAWQEAPATSDAEMNMPDLRLATLRPFEDVYANSVRRHLSWWPRWARRSLAHEQGVLPASNHGDGSRSVTEGDP